MDSHVSCSQIDIDFGHRAGKPDSGLCGRRGRIEAFIRCDLQDSGVQGGLCLSPDFLRDVLLEHIAAPCDRGLILDVHDPLLRTLRPTWGERDVSDAVLSVCAKGYMTTEGLSGKLYLIPDSPAAPNLARHWYERIKQPVLSRSGGTASLIGIRFWETPGGWSAYGPAFGSDSPVLDWEHML